MIICLAKLAKTNGGMLSVPVEVEGFYLRIQGDLLENTKLCDSWLKATLVWQVLVLH